MERLLENKAFVLAAVFIVAILSFGVASQRGKAAAGGLPAKVMKAREGKGDPRNDVTKMMEQNVKIVQEKLNEANKKR